MRPWCRQAKAFLKGKGVPFREVDVSRDAALVAELKAVSGQLGVPLTTDGRAVILGFDKAALERLAEAHGAA